MRPPDFLDVFQLSVFRHACAEDQQEVHKVIRSELTRQTS